MTICDPGSTTSRSVADGIWIKPSDGEFLKLPDKPEFPLVGYKTSSHWTEHLCVVGMGTHWQYGKCDLQYQFTVIYDANNFLVGVVNAVNLGSALDNAPPQIETTPALKLLGLVFNETRFDPCFNLSQPRMLIHVYLRKPELEFQSCPMPIVKTSANNQGLRCKLCWETMGSLLEDLCDGAKYSKECCCAMDHLADKEGSCYDQGCLMTSSCDGFDVADCTNGSDKLQPVWVLLLISLLIWVPCM